jgi:DNA polymerase-4
MQKRLERGGVTTIGQLRDLSREELGRIAGSFGETLYRYCRGQDDRPVRVSRDRKSLSSERTYERDLKSLEEMDLQIDRLADGVARGLERRRLSACTLTVKVRYEDFTTVTRSRSFNSPIRGAAQIASHARELLRRTDAGERRVRLLGVGTSTLLLGGVEQLSLFPEAPEDSAESMLG